MENLNGCDSGTGILRSGKNVNYMKYFVLSDIHGSSYYVKKALDIYQEGEFDRILLLGDILYHGPRNELPKGHAPKEVIALLNPLKEEILAVRGNCEAEVDQMVLHFPVMADYAVLELGERSIFMSHGHLYTNETFPLRKNGDVFLQGHTHLPVAEKKERDGLFYYHLNPGSVSLPKEGNPNSYGVLTEKGFQIFTLDASLVKELAF